MPNDETEQTRLNILHQVHLLILNNKLTKAPIGPNISRVLDIGTGPGDWAIAMGEQYPDAMIIATDISVWNLGDVPPNVSFQLDGAEEEWTYTEPFDLIHLRAMSGSFSDWDYIYKEAFKHLTPGGYIEISDWDHTKMAEISPDSYFTIYASANESAAEAAGYPQGQRHLEKSRLEAAGFTSIRSEVINVPMGTWPRDPRKKTIGKMWLISVLEGLEATSLRNLTKCKDWKVEDVRDLCEKVKSELVEPHTGAFTPVHFVVARKPLT